MAVPIATQLANHLASPLRNCKTIHPVAAPELLPTVRVQVQHRIRRDDTAANDVPTPTLQRAV